MYIVNGFRLAMSQLGHCWHFACLTLAQKFLSLFLLLSVTIRITPTDIILVWCRISRCLYVSVIVPVHCALALFQVQSWYHLILVHA